ncbi:MAG TPA: hypothetical protein VF767_05945 [Bryobacteraceae bacterium]
MRKLSVAAVLFVLCGAMIPVLAQNGLPSSKATADINTMVKCHMTVAPDGTVIPAVNSCVDLFSGGSVATQNQWIAIMEKKVKLSNSQSLFVSPSLVTGLYTQTRTKTQPGGTSTAVGEGGVYLRAELVPDAGGEPIVAAPLSQCSGGILGCVAPEAGKWGVVLDSRIQTLTQDLSACVIDVTSIAGTNDGSCTFTSTIDLILKTTSAHTFNFVFPNVGQGTYTVKVWAAVASHASYSGLDGGYGVGAAAFGLGSMTVESVRLVHDFSF